MRNRVIIIVATLLAIAIAVYIWRPPSSLDVTPTAAKEIQKARQR